MVEGYNQNISSHNSMTTPEKKSGELIFWIRPLQQAIAVEVDHGFTDIQGRKHKFSSFVSASLLTCPSVDIPEQEICKLKELALNYDRYPSMSISLRRRLIAQTRQSLQDLHKYDQKLKKNDLPNLKIRKSNNLNFNKVPLSDSLSLESSLSSIKGVGPKQAERLSRLGLVLIRDLINYFPRDYIDYTSLKTIDKTQAGQNVTIVATVRRSSSFKSPRNSNLSILELFIKDKTGGMKITRFFAGHRTSSIAYVKSQQSLYPVGATIAVSGLVKEGSYGKSINDPLIEIIDSPNSYLKSRTIGQIFPIYSLTDGITADKFRDLIQSILYLISDIKYRIDCIKSLNLSAVIPSVKE